MEGQWKDRLVELTPLSSAETGSQQLEPLCGMEQNIKQRIQYSVTSGHETMAGKVHQWTGI